MKERIALAHLLFGFDQQQRWWLEESEESTTEKLLREVKKRRNQLLLLPQTHPDLAASYGLPVVPNLFFIVTRCFDLLTDCVLTLNMIFSEDDE